VIARDPGTYEERLLEALWNLYLSLDELVARNTAAVQHAAPVHAGSGLADATGELTARRRRRVYERITATAELRHLMWLHAAAAGTEGDAARNRRIAELFELLDLDEIALHWWSRAALLGDRDAADYLEVLREDQDTPEEDGGAGLGGDDLSPSASSVIIPADLAGVEKFADTVTCRAAAHWDDHPGSAAMLLLEGQRKADDTRRA
jgi:hypothetical protein